MKKLSLLGIIGGAALLAAVPFSVQWSQENVGPAVPLLTVSHANAQYYRRVYRRAYRRAYYGGYYGGYSPYSYGGYSPYSYGGYSPYSYGGYGVGYGGYGRYRGYGGYGGYYRPY
jgi:hypothetical protein